MDDHIYKHIHLTGSSTESMEQAVRAARAKAKDSVRNVNWFKAIETRGHVVDGEVGHWQVTIEVGFRLD